MKKIIFLFVLSVLLTYCTDVEKNNTITMALQMTQCAEPWHDADYYNDKPTAVKKYLEKQGITVQVITVVENCSAAAVCAACTCLGCDLVTVTVDAKEQTALEKLKFVKK